MDQTSDGFAYRCLPLNIANSHGWVILNPAGFTAEWNGRPGLDGIRVEADDEDWTSASSHFGYGVLTFALNALFRTEPGFDLICSGPFNSFKDGIHPLTGVIETDWSPFTFTMNWRFTRKFVPIHFAVGEPICMIFPYRRADLEATQPEFGDISKHPELLAKYESWAKSRAAFNKALADNEEKAVSEKWQKEYFRGRGEFGQAPDSHRTRLRLPNFSKCVDS